MAGLTFSDILLLRTLIDCVVHRAPIAALSD